MEFYDPLADGETDAGAGILLSGVQPLEDGEDLLVELRVNADAIVRYRELPLVSRTAGCDVDSGWLSGTVELDGVAHQILEKLDQLGAIGPYGWQFVVGNFGPALLDGRLQVVQRCYKEFSGGD